MGIFDFYLMKKVLVTGGVGFVRHHLKSFLGDKDYEVVGVDIKNNVDLRTYE